MDDPIQAQHRAMMNSLAEVIDNILNGNAKTLGTKPKIAFILLMAEFGAIEDGRVNYISNGSREDTIAMMKEYIARAEGRAPTHSKGSA